MAGHKSNKWLYLYCTSLRANSKAPSQTLKSTSYYKDNAGMPTFTCVYIDSTQSVTQCLPNGSELAAALKSPNT